MTDTFENLGQQIDRLENLSCALQIPLPAELHVEQLRKALPELVSDLKDSFITITNTNPWE